MGTGLGLSSVYGFVIQSGGSIDIASEIGKGTTVTLDFSVCEEQALDAIAAKSAEPVLMDSRVLLVEDNDLIANTLAALLKQEGAQLTRVDSADAAQAELSSDSQFDLMLSDIKIPGAMNGFGLARWVRQQFPELRIGVMSGHGSSLNQDFDIPVLAKPFTRKELLSYLAERNAEAV